MSMFDIEADKRTTDYVFKNCDQDHFYYEDISIAYNYALHEQRDLDKKEFSEKVVRRMCEICPNNTVDCPNENCYIRQELRNVILESD